MEIDINDQLTFESVFGSHHFRNECAVCLGEHDDEVHAATLRVRSRFRGHVTQYLDREAPFTVEDVKFAELFAMAGIR